jgi:ubiquinone/menaquinone biosynthesis C-methylase UbiE
MNNVYTHGHHESVLRSHSWRTAENSAAYLLPHLRPGLSLLDIGAGPGTITADLARLVEPGRTTALEAGETALDITRGTFAKLDISVDFVVGDVHRLDLPEDAYDVVHAHQVLQHVADPVQALREMRRVCKPGGIVAARDSDYHAFTWFPALPELDEWMALYQRMARANGGEPAPRTPP